MTRLKCRMFGCICAADYPGCHRCEAGIYDANYVQIGALDPLYRAYWRVRHFVERLTGRRCEVCRKRYWRGYDEWVCSDRCFTDWLPF